MFQKIHFLKHLLTLGTFLMSTGICTLPRDIDELISQEKKKGAIATLTCSLDAEIDLYFVDTVIFYPGQRGIGTIQVIEKTEDPQGFIGKVLPSEKTRAAFYKITFEPPQSALPKWPPIPLTLYRKGLPVPGTSVLSTLGLSNLCRSTGDGVLHKSNDEILESSS